MQARRDRSRRVSLDSLLEDILHRLKRERNLQLENLCSTFTFRYLSPFVDALNLKSCWVWWWLFKTTLSFHKKHKSTIDSWRSTFFPPALFSLNQISSSAASTESCGFKWIFRPSFSATLWYCKFNFRIKWKLEKVYRSLWRLLHACDLLSDE